MKELFCTSRCIDHANNSDWRTRKLQSCGIAVFRKSTVASCAPRQSLVSIWRGIDINVVIVRCAVAKLVVGGLESNIQRRHVGDMIWKDYVAYIVQILQIEVHEGFKVTALFYFRKGTDCCPPCSVTKSGMVSIGRRTAASVVAIVRCAPNLLLHCCCVKCEFLSSYTQLIDIVDVQIKISPLKMRTLGLRL